MHLTTSAQTLPSAARKSHGGIYSHSVFPQLNSMDFLIAIQKETK